jgi:hypothetical protein
MNRRSRRRTDLFAAVAASVGNPCEMVQLAIAGQAENLGSTDDQIEELRFWDIFSNER